MSRRLAPDLDGYESGEGAHLRATNAARMAAERARTVVFVEGISDQIAVDAMLARAGRDTAAEQIVVLPIGGAQAIAKFVDEFANRDDIILFGLCDEAEAAFFGEALGVEGRDYFVCAPDLEAELIAAFDPSELEVVIEREGELKSLRTMQKQAVWRDRPFDEQLHRWMRAKAVRSSRYASILIEAAHEARLPRPLRDLVERI